MFKYLKRRFMIIYSLSILFLITFSFSLIFYSSYSDIKNEIAVKLSPREFEKGPLSAHEDGHKEFWDSDNNNDINIFSDDIFLVVDEDFNILNIGSYESLSKKDIEYVQNILKDGTKTFFKLGDNYYTYAIQGDMVKLIDITQNVTYLTNLAITLLISGVLIAILTLIIGNFFASNALKSVKNNFERQAEFVSNASHEIKTPISVISSCLELIKEGDDESDKWIEYCIKETDRLKNLTSNLLTLSKESHSIDIHNLEKINISDKLELLLCAYEVNLFEKNFELITDIEENITLKILDEDFSQIFHILIDNAIKYNDSRKRIKVVLKKNDKNVSLKFFNSSDFIDDYEISKIFDRFYRNDKSRNKNIEGFGLGLALVKQIMERYNFKYKVTYEDSMFVFSVYFPYN